MQDPLSKELIKAQKKARKSEFTQQLRAKYPKTLHKELLGWRDREGDAPVDPEQTLYQWWWRFMRSANAYPEVKVEAAAGGRQEQSLADTEQAFGDLGEHFGAWWHRIGQTIFAEETIPLIHVLKPSPDDEDYKRDVGVVMIVPMTISRRLLIEQFKVVLDVYHPNAMFKRHAASTAKMKLHPRKRDIEVNYGRLLKMWEAKRANDLLPPNQQKDDWKLFCEAAGLHDLKKSLGGKDKSVEKAELSKEFYNLYKQADEIMKNAVLGTFPKDDEYQKYKGRKSADKRGRGHKKDQT